MYATSQEKFDFNENVTTYTAQEMPAINQEAFVGNIQNYTSGVAFELSATRFPNRPMKSYSTDWESLVQTIGKFDDFGAELNRTGYFETDVDALLSAATDDADKIARLFGFIKSHMNWNQYNDFRCDKGVRAAYKDKTGNAAEINLMLTATLRYAGLDANPVLISTRSNGIFHFPNLMAFNYVIVAVETPNGQLLLDATEKMATPNVLPIRDLNGIGRLIRRDGSSAAIDLMPKSLSREIDFLDFTVTADGMASGKIRSQLTNHKALEFRKKGSPGEKQLYVEELENRFNGIVIEDYARENDTDLYKPIVENYSFNDKRTPEIVNGKIYISPLLFLAMKNPLQADTRNYPVEFDYPFGNKYHITIEIPSGYLVESMPAPINLIAADGIGTFKYLIATAANKIQLTVTFEVNWPTVPATQYETLKKFWQRAADKENEKIVLVKKTL